MREDDEDVVLRDSFDWVMRELENKIINTLEYMDNDRIITSYKSLKELRGLVCKSKSLQTGTISFTAWNTALKKHKKEIT